jgi:hypothetical protein
VVWFIYTLLISTRAVEHLIWLWPVGSHLVLNEGEKDSPRDQVTFDSFTFGGRGMPDPSVNTAILFEIFVAK